MLSCGSTIIRISTTPEERREESVKDEGWAIREAGARSDRQKGDEVKVGDELLLMLWVSGKTAFVAVKKPNSAAEAHDEGRFMTEGAIPLPAIAAPDEIGSAAG